MEKERTYVEIMQDLIAGPRDEQLEFIASMGQFIIADVVKDLVAAYNLTDDETARALIAGCVSALKVQNATTDRVLGHPTIH